MTKVSKMKRKKSKGFTLIELLVVVAIIGILAAIAIPQFAEYRARGFNARVESDARNSATAEEAYFVDNDEYYTGDCTGLPGMNVSEDVNCVASSADVALEFQIDTDHASATVACTWNSASGGGANLVCS